jgi:hypothetical protein
VPTPGTVFHPPATSGAWTPGAVEYVLDKRVLEQGKMAALEASCTFSFKGNKASGDLHEASSKVVLCPTPAKFRIGAKPPLRDGEKALDEFGNKLTAAALGHLLSL